MSVAADATNNENVLTQQKGNHKGCPYDELAGGIFRGMSAANSQRVGSLLDPTLSLHLVFPS